MVIVINQSGETADTLAALQRVQGKGFKVLGIVKVVEAPLHQAEWTHVHLGGPEIAVSATTRLTVLNCTSSRL